MEEGAPDTLLTWYRLAKQLTLLLFPGTLNSPLMFSSAIGNPTRDYCECQSKYYLITSLVVDLYSYYLAKSLFSFMNVLLPSLLSPSFTNLSFLPLFLPPSLSSSLSSSLLSFLSFSLSLSSFLLLSLPPFSLPLSFSYCLSFMLPKGIILR